MILYISPVPRKRISCPQQVDGVELATTQTWSNTILVTLGWIGDGRNHEGSSLIKERIKRRRREGGRDVLNAIKDYQWIFSNLFHILHNEHLLRVSCISASRITLGYEDMCTYDNIIMWVYVCFYRMVYCTCSIIQCVRNPTSLRRTRKMLNHPGVSQSKYRASANTFNSNHLCSRSLSRQPCSLAVALLTLVLTA